MQEFQKTPKWKQAGDPITQLSNVVMDIRAFTRPDDNNERVHGLIAAPHAPEDEEVYITRLAQTLKAALELNSDVILDCSSVPRPKTIVRALAAAGLDHSPANPRQFVLCGLNAGMVSALRTMHAYNEHQLILPGEKGKAFPVYPDIETAAAALLGLSAVEIKGQATSGRERLELKLGQLIPREEQALSSAQIGSSYSRPAQREAVFKQMGFRGATLLSPRGASYTDSGAGQEFASEFRTIAGATTGPIILDLTSVTSLSGDALGALIEESRNTRLTIIGSQALPSPLPRLLTVVRDMQEALDRLT